MLSASCYQRLQIIFIAHFYLLVIFGKLSMTRDRAGTQSTHNVGTGENNCYGGYSHHTRWWCDGVMRSYPTILQFRSKSPHYCTVEAVGGDTEDTGPHWSWRGSQLRSTTLSTPTQATHRRLYI